MTPGFRDFLFLDQAFGSNSINWHLAVFMAHGSISVYDWCEHVRLVALWKQAQSSSQIDGTL